jgi:hypothetical protein
MIAGRYSRHDDDADDDPGHHVIHPKDPATHGIELIIPQVNGLAGIDRDICICGHRHLLSAEIRIGHSDWLAKHDFSRRGVDPRTDATAVTAGDAAADAIGPTVQGVTRNPRIALASVIGLTVVRSKVSRVTALGIGPIRKPYQPMDFAKRLTIMALGAGLPTTP